MLVSKFSRSLGRNRTAVVAMVMLLSLSIPSAVIAPVQADPPEQEVVHLNNLTAAWIFSNVWAFSGVVSGEQTIGGLTVDFGGIAEGNTCITNSLGGFYKAIAISESGTATAIAYSVDGIPSNEERTEAGN